MTEVIIDTDVGKKRRLPIWMSRVSATGELRKSGNQDENCLLIEGQCGTQAAGSMVKAITGKHGKKILTQETQPSERGEFSQRYEAKQRTRKVNRRDEGPNNFIPNCNEAGVVKKKPKKENTGGRTTVHERAVSKKQNPKSNGPKSSKLEVVSPARCEDEIDLTMEDLMSIAEEFVNADNEKQLEELAKRESKSEAQPSSSSTFCKGSGRPLQADGCSQALSKCTTTRFSSHLTETGRKDKERTTVENPTANSIRSGDAAQDMLDLFLGPLLKKPPPQERGLWITKTESMTLAHEYSTQDRSGVQKEEAPLMKKKSSLKDKVAVLLE